MKCKRKERVIGRKEGRKEGRKGVFLSAASGLKNYRRFYKNMIYKLYITYIYLIFA
jgi:hypothetical protein